MGRSGLALDKSRLVHQRANNRATEWRSVGRITILGNELDGPIIIERSEYIVVFQEEGDGELRSAVVMLNRARRAASTRYLYFGAGLFALGVGIGRVWGV